jgi:hypothetical protein
MSVNRSSFSIAVIILIVTLALLITMCSADAVKQALGDTSVGAATARPAVDANDLTGSETQVMARIQSNTYSTCIAGGGGLTTAATKFGYYVTVNCRDDAGGRHVFTYSVTQVPNKTGLLRLQLMAHATQY